MRSLACSMVMAHRRPWPSRSRRVFSSKSRVSEHFGGTKLDVESIGLKEVRDFHGVNDLSKNVLCTVSPSGSRITLRYRPSISAIWPHRRMRPSTWTNSLADYPPLAESSRLNV